MEINQQFIDLINELLGNNAWTHDDLAEKSGVSRTTISRILNRKIKTVRPTHYKAIANLVNEPENATVEIVKDQFEKALLEQYRQLDLEHKALALHKVIQVKYKMQGRTEDSA